MASATRVGPPRHARRRSIAGDTHDAYASTVGSATHRVIAQLASGSLGQPRDELVDAAWPLSADAVTGAVVGQRRRSARLEVVGAVAVYLDRFLPDAECELLGSEYPLGRDGRVDLAWQRVADRCVVFDELKTLDSRSIPTGPGATADQVARYVAAGRRLHGDAFLGLRLLFLGAPSRSLFVEPDGRRRLLGELDPLVAALEPEGGAR